MANTNLPLERARQFQRRSHYAMEQPFAESKGHIYTFLSLHLYENLQKRRHNPILGGKTATRILDEIDLIKIRKFLLEIPYPVLQTLVTGTLDEKVLSASAPDSNLPFPCIYVSKLTCNGGRLTCRQVGMLSDTLLDDDETTEIIYKQYDITAADTTSPIGRAVREGLHRMVANWHMGLCAEGFDFSNLYDAAATAWDTECPFQFSYVGYSNAPVQRFKAHDDWQAPITPRSVGHVLRALVAELFPVEDIQYISTMVWNAWTTEWRLGKFAELIVAEIVSCSAGVYTWEGGLNVNVLAVV